MIVLFYFTYRFADNFFLRACGFHFYIYLWRIYKAKEVIIIIINLASIITYLFYYLRKSIYPNVYLFTIKHRLTTQSHTPNITYRMYRII